MDIFVIRRSSLVKHFCIVFQTSFGMLCNVSFSSCGQYLPDLWISMVAHGPPNLTSDGFLEVDKSLESGIALPFALIDVIEWSIVRNLTG